jgi:hypothetical protein
MIKTTVRMLEDTTSPFRNLGYSKIKGIVSVLKEH